MFGGAVNGQEDHQAGLKLKVKIKYHGTPYVGGKIYITKDDSPFDIVSMASSSSFVYLFEYGGIYHVQFSGEGQCSCRN